MHLVLPAAQGLRTLYALSSERLWFSLAVVAGLVLAAELAELILLLNAPMIEPLTF
ncbi:hypothetical protein [Pararhodobacter zhoushanensis]|uniref:Uncharacterized protein n=1 Tax=Pararhodobacter zhoushanensis TaxID=2479545 RepID=A0ABT3GZ14_9RHOB|nr:hypothetical protein [Pararhodobacter zhoushanensis]MCW1932776.1 hypothetical protein [Pararhodobacter zhoushanensis]